MVDQGGAEDLSQFAGGVAAEGFHLPESVLRGDVALGEDEVVEGCGRGCEACCGCRAGW